MGTEIGYILARNGFVVHIFDKKQPCMCKIEKNIPLKAKMQNELAAWSSPTYFVAKRLGVNLENIECDFVDMMREKLLTFPNVSLIDAEIDEINLDELTLLSTGNATTEAAAKNLTRFVGENKIAYFHPECIKIKDIKKENLHHDHGEFFHVNLSKEEFDAACEYLKAHRALYDNNLPKNEISVEKRADVNMLRTFLRPIYSEKEKAYASIKLKKEGENFLLEGFYSALSDEEQKELLSLFAAFSDISVMEYGKIYKRTYLNSTQCLNRFLQVKNYDNLFICGSFLGVGGVQENLLLANFVAYNLMNASLGRNLQECPKNCCTNAIYEKLLQKSALNYRLLNLDYDIIKKSETFNTDDIEMFREKFYQKHGNCHF